MLARLLPRAPTLFRRIHNVPFHDDLTPVDEDLFNLLGFQQYKESPDVRAHREKLGLSVEDAIPKEERREPSTMGDRLFKQLCVAKEPVVFVSKFTNPYLNLAIEDYVYNQMPLPEDGNCNRLMFYVNEPCVVIGKNQNPWKEVNLPLLNDLQLPMVRRRSGGGTVVHDTGNVNYSFMTTKGNFDRHTFANLVAAAVNLVASPEKAIKVTERGDIVTEQGNLKVSGSAYKLSKGKSYHHGTMLLNLRLDILRQLLHRDAAKLGTVKSSAAVDSVRSPVTNLEITNNEFIDAVSEEFKQTYGKVTGKSQREMTDEEYDQTELLGLEGLVQAYSERDCEIFTIDEGTILPQEILAVKLELETWQWKYGATPKFTYELTHESGFSVNIDVGKNGLVQEFSLNGASEQVSEHFQYLQLVLSRGSDVEFSGSSIAGFVLDDELSEWIGNAIDGTS